MCKVSLKDWHRAVFYSLQEANKFMNNMQNNAGEIQLDEHQQAAFKEIWDNPMQNFFIQGQAGTGKSTLINHIRKQPGRGVAVVAPTGIAAELIGGATIHSMFKLGGKPYFPLNVVNTYKKYDEVVSAIDTLIIDEVSMLRADVFDTIDFLCKKAKKNDSAPFGGIQVILVGDLYQLPPVYKSEDKDSLSYMMATYSVCEPYFFDAKCFRDGEFKTMKLEIVHRQSADDSFRSQLRTISALNNDGNRKSVSDAVCALNSRWDAYAEEKALLNNISIVTATNASARRINERKLAELPGAPQKYTGEFEGPYYDDRGCNNSKKERLVVPEHLCLKVGAKVMICCNDLQAKMYVNGSMGEVVELNQECIIVEVNGEKIEIRKHEWKEQEYRVSDNGTLELYTVGTYRQFPLKLAYAITIHKSQGQTWDNVCIDLGDRGAFAPGQAYVALSRVKAMEGFSLVHKLSIDDVEVNPRIQHFLDTGKVPQGAIDLRIQTLRRYSNVMKSFWREHFPCASVIRFSTLSMRRRLNCDVRHFWFTVRKDILEEDLYLVCSDYAANKSLFFKVPAGALDTAQLGLDLNQSSTDDRNNRNVGKRDAFRSTHVDLFIANIAPYCEEYMGNVELQPYLIAVEENGIISTRAGADDMV